MDALISAVFTRNALWNQKDKDHHNNLVLAKLWKEVALECNLKGKYIWILYCIYSVKGQPNAETRHLVFTAVDISSPLVEIMVYVTSVSDVTDFSLTGTYDKRYVIGKDI